MGRNREREKIRALVSAYLDGELSPDEASSVGRRIQEDPAYARAYSAYRGIRMDLRALAKPEMPPGLSAAIRAQAAVMQPRRAALSIRQRVARVTAAAATLIATLAALLTGGFGLQNQFAPAIPGGNRPTTISIQSGPTTATVLNPTIRYDESAQIQFTRPMNAEIVKNRVLFSPGVAPSLLEYDSQRFVLSTKPKSLLPDTRYTVQIPAGLTDAEGNDVSPGIFSFAVGNAPGIVALPTTFTPATVAPTATALAVADTATAVVSTATTVPVSVAEPVVTATNEPAPASAPATEASAAVQPTPTPKPVAPRPTNTPVPVQPTQKPAGTVIAAVEPTATPAPTAAPTATATAAPPVAPTATATTVPTVAPTATTPATPVADRFKGAYATMANRLGEPVSTASATTTSQIFFQNGFMVYVSGQPIYAFSTGGKTYAAYPNPGNSGAGSEGGPGPAAGLYKPKNAFGVLWTQKNLQGTLGYATQANESGGSGMIQQFEGGTILSVGGDVYVLLKNGSWQPFSG